MRLFKYSILLVAVGAAVFGLAPRGAQAANLLTNGGFEAGGGGPANWTLNQSITGMPGAPISVAELVDSADIGFLPSPGVGGLGLLVKPFAGNSGTYQDQNKSVNLSMTQTVAVAPGKNFTFTGHSYYQIAASNNIDTLFADSPSGAVASPTVTAFTVDFLDSGGNVIAGSSQTINPPKNRATDVNPDDWVTSTTSALNSPANAASARVTVSATNMVASCTTACTGGQDVHFDNFSLVQNGAFGGEKLLNGNLNTVGAPAGFSIVKTAQDNISFTGDASYAANTGSVGMWLRAYLAGDAKLLSNPVAATAGAQYTFSAFSKWEVGYGSDNPFPPSGQTRTSTFMKIDFLNSSNTLIGSQTLDLCQADPNNSGLCSLQHDDTTWRQFSTMATAPAGTAFVQVEAGAANMYDTGVNPQSAFFDDLSLTSSAAAGVPGDYNGNGVVDMADYVLWRNGGPLQNEVNTVGTVDASDYTAWRARFGNTSGSGSGLGSAAVPEPASLCLMLVGSAIAFISRRRED